jgi:hypothetical protein
VEIVISDNCSDDDTLGVISKFQEFYPEKIKYCKTAMDIVDKNFEHVLSLARGEFLKLNNDTLLWRDGSLAEVLRILRMTRAEQPLLFFLNGNSCCPEPIVAIHGLNKFIRNSSFNST